MNNRALALYAAAVAWAWDLRNDYYHLYISGWPFKSDADNLVCQRIVRKLLKLTPDELDAHHRAL